MNIKPSILTLMALLGASFSAYSQAYTCIVYNSSESAKEMGFSYGVIYDPYIAATTFPYSNVRVRTCRVTFINSIGKVVELLNGAKQACTGVVNSSTSICETQPQCENGQTWNEELGVCEDIPYCESEEVQHIIQQEQAACSASGGEFSYESFNGNGIVQDELNITCTEAPPVDPDLTAPLDPPSGSFNPDSPNTANPSAPSFDKTEPDSVTPTDKTDTALQNLNRDSNEASTALNKDLNQGFADLGSALDGIDKKAQALGEKLDDQTKHDYLIQEANRKLMIESMKAMNGVGDQIEIAIEGQTGQIVDALGQLSDGIGTGSLTHTGCTSFSCEGDAAICYLAKQSWENECSTSAAEKDLQSVLDGFSEDIKQNAEGAYDENGAFVGVFTDTEESVDSLLDAYNKSNGFNFDGGCPAPRTYTPLGAVMEINYQPFCDLAIVFRVFIMASAAIGSFLMIAKFI